MSGLYPTHKTKGIFSQKGIKIQTQWLKFHCAEGADSDTQAKEAVEKYLTEISKKKPFELLSVETKKLPSPKLGAKLNKQHNYVTLRATFLDGDLKLTTSWGGLKLSGDFVGNPATTILFSSIAAWEKRNKGANIAGRMADLCQIAHNSKTFDEFLQGTDKLLGE